MSKKVLVAVATAISISTLFLTASCAHEPKIQEDRTVANSFDHQDEAEADYEQAKNAVLSQNSEILRQQLVKARIAQTLVASFDERMAQLKTEVEVDQLLGSELYCKLMNVRSIHEHTEGRLIDMMRASHSAGGSSVRWIYEQMSLFAKTGVAEEATVGNLFRALADEEIQICGSSHCIRSDLSLLTHTQVNPLDDKKFNKFIKRNKKAIAAYSNSRAADLKPGDCFTNSSRLPQQVAYDWANRNWVGSVLPDGQFVFTYDDGPHKTFTRQIRDTWSKAGMAKPAFFMLRKQATVLPDIVKELNQADYVIASHSERHANLGNLAKAANAGDFDDVNRQIFTPEVKNLPSNQFNTWKTNTLNREINQSMEDLSAMINKPIRYFRLPYGSGVRNDLIGQRFQALNTEHFFWRIDSLDWQDKNPESIRDRVVAAMKVSKRGIVLFHDVHPQSAAAAQLMVNYFKANPKYKAVSIRDIPGLKPQ